MKKIEMTGIDRIATERRRQIEAGWTPERDEEYTFGEISGAAVAYATLASRQKGRDCTRRRRQGHRRRRRGGTPIGGSRPSTPSAT